MQHQSSPRRHLPGLDGLRAVAVAAIVVFHWNHDWLPGGFVSLSLFFALSGFLITRLLLDELDRGGRLDLRRFYGRRVRRLAPASLFTIAAVCVWAVVDRGAPTGPGLRGDALAALLQVANWHFVVGHRDYATLFAGPSPLLHFWSLAIEEQFYLVIPLLLAALWRWGLRRRGIVVALTVLVALSTAAAFVTTDPTVGYYATHTRAAELLVGCATAALLHHRRLPRGPLLQAAGACGLAVLAVASVAAQVNEPFLLRGGFTVMAAASAAAVLAATSGPLARVMSLRPLRYVGTISYAVYLFHWPLWLWCRSHGYRGWLAFCLSCVVLLLLASLSMVLLEGPVRSGRWPAPGRRARLAYLSALAATALVVVAVAPAPVDPVVAAPDDAAHAVVTWAPIATAAAGDTSAVATTSTEPAPRRLLVLGSDLSLARRLTDSVPAGWEVVDHADDRCPAFASDAFRTLNGTEVERDCARTTWEDDVVATHPDAVAVGIGLMERLPYRINGTTWVDTDAALRTAALGEVVLFLQRLNRPVVVEDQLADSGDPVAAEWNAQASAAGLHPLATSVAEWWPLVEQIAPSRQATVDRRPLRVLLVGDSTAYALSAGLAQASAGVLDVVSVGVIRCPLVRAAATRSKVGDEQSTAACPRFDVDWPRFVATYDIDVVLAVDSLAEQWDQRYPGDDIWYSPGSDGYRTFHDREFDALLSELARMGVPMLVADAPRLRQPGDGSLGYDDARVAAWNEELTRWAAASDLVTMVPFARYFAEPGSAADRTERPDGVHVTPEFGAEITRSGLLASILAAWDRWRVAHPAAGG